MSGNSSNSGGSDGSKGGSGAEGGAAAGATPQVRVISVDFAGGNPTSFLAGNSGITMQPSEVAGFRPAANWNSAPGPMGALTTLIFSDGSPAGASVTWDAPVTSTAPGVLLLGYTDAPGDVRMMNGVLNPAWSDLPSTAATMVTLSDLPAEIASSGYDVYVYVLGGIPDAQERKYAYTIGSTTFNVTQSGPTPTTVTTPYAYVLAPDMGSGNYIVFKHIVGATFSLVVSPSDSPTLRAPVNGLQIVWPSGS